MGDCFLSGRAFCAWELLISSHMSPAVSRDGWHGRSPDPQAMALRELGIDEFGCLFDLPEGEAKRWLMGRAVLGLFIC